MINETKKSEIEAAIEREAVKLGSMNAVARKLGVSGATLSANILNPDNWHKVSPEMWGKLAAGLGLSLVGRQWNLVPTGNLKIMHRLLSDAQNEAMFMAVSEKGGSGKTAAIAAYRAQDQLRPQPSVYSLQCEGWGLKTLLTRLCREVGVSVGRYDTSELLVEQVVRFFKERGKGARPLLVLDEADKLRPAALLLLITLYNRLEDEIGLVVCGTDFLERDIKAGVQKARKGYDEIDSRLGRNFIHLVGATRAEVVAICAANGVSDSAAQDRVWQDANPIRKLHGRGYVWLVEDLRRVKRGVKRERLLLVEN
jgi:hypothetical protein